MTNHLLCPRRIGKAGLWQPCEIPCKGHAAKADAAESAAHAVTCPLSGAVGLHIQIEL